MRDLGEMGDEIDDYMNTLYHVPMENNPRTWKTRSSDDIIAEIAEETRNYQPLKQGDAQNNAKNKPSSKPLSLFKKALLPIIFYHKPTPSQVRLEIEYRMTWTDINPNRTPIHIQDRPEFVNGKFIIKAKAIERRTQGKVVQSVKSKYGN